ncbi:MAG: HPr family phosphocarrier protein [Elusimicrobiaceae bacterium]|nr:HPr family phosphocarrier protein [Elusimicrobiaceae bacterium]
MLKEDVIILNRLGLHARPAALFVQTAARYKSEITVTKDGVDVNGKSVMGMMMLAAGAGTALTLTVAGEDEADAMGALKGLFERKFDEE